MGIIKNTDILLRRAEEHKAADHISQGSYGVIDYSKNGKIETTEWRGCAIGCLATETTIQALMKQDDFDFDFDAALVDHENGVSYYEIRLTSPRLREMLQNKFGMPNKLIFLAEAIFEGADPEYARDWPVEFAKAMKTLEGINITDDDIDSFWKKIVSERSIGCYDYPEEFDPGNFVDDDELLWGIDDYFQVVDYDVGNMLISWTEDIYRKFTHE